jgi:hypothetical protein
MGLKAQAGFQPVACHQHLAREFGVACLTGLSESTRALKGKDNKQAETDMA